MIKLYLILLAMLLFQLSSLAQYKSYNRNKTNEFTTQEQADAFNVNPDSLMLDSVIIAHRNKYSIVGIASMIIKNGEVIWNKNYGYRDRENKLPINDSTIMAMGSISKTFVATSIMQLWQQDMVHLDSSINKYLPDGLRVANPYFPDNTITVRMLMTHTSSLQENWNVMDPLWVCGDSPVPLKSFLIGYLTPGGKYYSSGNFYNYPSGSQWNYTNVSYSLLALAVENITGKSFDQYCKDSIFTPLSMNSSYWFLAGIDQSNLAIPYQGGIRTCQEGDPGYPAGRLRTNKYDMIKFLTAYMNYGSYGNGSILDSATVALMLSDQIGYPAVMALPWFTYTQGLSWWQDFPISKTAWSRGGSDQGALAYVSIDPKEKWLTIWFQNYRPDNTIVGHGGEINKPLADYAHFYGNIYSLRPKVINPYAEINKDSVLFSTKFSNIYNHQFTPYLIYTNSDSTEIDSVTLYDDGLHGDLLSKDGIYGGYIPSQLTEDFYSLGVSTLNNQTNKYFITPNVAGFTTAGPVKVDSVSITYSSNRYRVTPYLTNKGNSYIIKNVGVIMSTNEGTLIPSGSNNIPGLAPGETVAANINYFVTVDSAFTGEFNFDFEISSDGWTYWTNSIQAIVTGIEDKLIQPLTFTLEQNYPNPFNPTTSIQYSIANRQFITLKIFNVLGQEIETLVNEEKPAGNYQVEFNSANLPSGVYFYRIQAGDFVETKKMILMK